MVDATLPRVSELVADIIRVMRLTGTSPSEVFGMAADGNRPDRPVMLGLPPGQHKTAHHDKGA